MYFTASMTFSFPGYLTQSLPDFSNRPATFFKSPDPEFGFRLLLFTSPAHRLIT
jgi:hypothetical protein